MERRAFITTITALTAGCLGSRAGATQTTKSTSSSDPTTTRTQCPPPENASRLVCSTGDAPSGSEIYLTPSRTKWAEGSTTTSTNVIRSIRFTLHNESPTLFTVNTEGWTLRKHSATGWTTVAIGNPSSGTEQTLQQSSYAWELSRRTHPTPYTPRVTHFVERFQPGTYAFTVTGTRTDTETKLACAAIFTYHRPASDRTWMLTASPVETHPADVTPLHYPQPAVQNPFITNAAEQAVKAAHHGDWQQTATVTIPANRLDTVTNAVEALPASMSAGGNYIEYKGVVVCLFFSSRQTPNSQSPLPN